jgi:hypothetical protein
VARDPLVLKILQRLRRTDAVAARRAQTALDDLLTEGGLADLTQHDLQGFLWFTLPEGDEPAATAAALAQFFEFAEMGRYAGIAASDQTRDILRLFEERGHVAGVRAATRAMEASGVVPPDLPELEWGDDMASQELSAYERVAATLELALAAGELKPGGRGWRLTQSRLTKQQLTMPRMDGPPLLDRIHAERIDTWAEAGGHARRSLTAGMTALITAEPGVPDDVVNRVSPIQWLLELAAGRGLEAAGVPLTVTGNLARRVVQEAAERFGWRDPGDRPPRSEQDLWRATELRTQLQRGGVLRRTGRKLVLANRGRMMLDNPAEQWSVAMRQLVDGDDFEGAVQEVALMLLLLAGGMVEMRSLIEEVTEVVAGAGWRDTGNGDPPDEAEVGRSVWRIVRRCQLWSMVDQAEGPNGTVRIRLSDAGKQGGYAALRYRALRPSTAPES